MSFDTQQFTSTSPCTVSAPDHPTYNLRAVIRAALAEDAGNIGDVTCLSTIPEGTQATAYFVAKADGVLAGATVAHMVFEEVDSSLVVEWKVKDGAAVTKGDRIADMKGSAHSLLQAERVALNFMQRMSGTATQTRKMVEAAKPATILDTRKTVPGLRLVDKWAVVLGGGKNHRMGLYDMLMIKDNHIDASGSIEAAVKNARKYLKEKKLSIPIEVETRNMSEVEQALKAVDESSEDDNKHGPIVRIMLDNMTQDTMREAVALCQGKVETEASGNVTLETIGGIGACGVTYISSGALTHSVTALDISMKIDTSA
mmetsp:Transcript_14008/g.16965  ORF Transcript_14008/g.16965 Transcript_14008/m.16965 type:complete len:314 (-) Transcript_14008:370-1311(-)|eukprot:CAMPEP_0197853002 /NCGR_PEP_ID=MMETSP1438-20131217/21912_1 /TAXON_ID=1461541 /ORGANISM="Pterosperma sp., Strain CCMP1384" /LENGTH=313 /DNA_ID=CAMNT_0043467265 /DNA_START=168 /DNA_END=1109 /DNA_ORIENTATION=-